MASRDSLSVRDLMLPYARYGFADWIGKESEDEKRNAREALKQKIVEESDLDNSTRELNSNKFVPMPKRERKADVGRSFFLPRKYKDETRQAWTFILFIRVKKRANLAFRFEPKNLSGERHDYAHMQLCHSFIREKTHLGGVPDWLPQSDPAFPLPCSNSLELFLAMLVSVHGGSKIVEKTIREAFQRESRTDDARAYVTKLHEMLEKTT